jgi:predicted O-methyltransferase YrrM
MNPIKTLQRIAANNIKNAILKALNEQNQNIYVARQKKALSETVEYVNSKMDNIQSCSTKEKVLEFASLSCKVDGIFLEFGVYSGYTINLIAELFKQKTIYGFDSFQGLPENWRDGFPIGEFNLMQLPIVKKNVKLIQGRFDETLPDFVNENHEDIAFLYIDCDLYSSTKTIFDILKNKINKGTIIVFDEYFNYPGWSNGEYKAFQEFVKENNIKYRYLTYNNLNEQVALIIE